MHLGQSLEQTARFALGRRNDGNSDSQNMGTIIASVVIVALLAILLTCYFVARSLRARHVQPKYLPTEYLKQKWQSWTPSNMRQRQALADQWTTEEAHRATTPAETLSRLRQSIIAPSAGSQRNSWINNNDVDRRTSVRSVMTLPSYTPDARPSEQIIGREGDRGGVDTVVEFPETIDEEDARREEEMESLYQIRLARRAERDVREEQRRLRREARERGDTAVLEELRDQRERDRERSGSTSTRSAALISEHNTKDRSRKISQVSYFDVGLARHDGSRVRAGSDESGRPLLESPAPMGDERGNRANASTPSIRTHHYNQSTTSLRYTQDMSDDDDSDAESRALPSGASARSTTNLPLSRQHTAVSTQESTHPSISNISTDVVPDADQPPTASEPPQYDDAWRRMSRRSAAPPYESPTDGRLPPVPAISSFSDVELNTPVDEPSRQNENR